MWKIQSQRWTNIQSIHAFVGNLNCISPKSIDPKLSSSTKRNTWNTQNLYSCERFEAIFERIYVAIFTFHKYVVTAQFSHKVHIVCTVSHKHQSVIRTTQHIFAQMTSEKESPATFSQIAFNGKCTLAILWNKSND